MRRIGGGVLLVVIMGCVRATVPSAPPPNAPTFRVNVQVEKAIESAEVGVQFADGGTLFAGRVHSGQPAFEPLDWYRGPGHYVLSFSYERPDGGRVDHETPLDLRATDIEVAGYVRIDDRHAAPEVRLELVASAPGGVRLEPASGISRSGHASYVLTNSSNQALYPEPLFFGVQRHAARGWVEANHEECTLVALEAGPLEPGSQKLLRSEEFTCLSDPLEEGRFRHVLRLRDDEDFGFDSELRRSFVVTREFDSMATEATSASLFPDVPASQLRIDRLVRGSGGHFTASLVGPDGGTACVCPGSLVGKEQFRAIVGFAGICLTANPDASVIVCEQFEGGRHVGDHPPFPFRQLP